MGDCRLGLIYYIYNSGFQAFIKHYGTLVFETFSRLFNSISKFNAIGQS